jgi:NADH:ubiquinone oxidoreductase subunit F (NADH-binding)/(2Fe-2S) ferredoxin/Pyruvate/2-oxoacid:ferredoxin oxidoreductase delta subunit
VSAHSKGTRADTMPSGSTRAEIDAHALTLVRICTGSGCVMNGSLDAAAQIEAAIAAAGASERVRVVRTGCHGLCELGPITVISPDEVFYPKVTAEKAARIVQSILGDGQPVSEYLFRETAGGSASAGQPIAHYNDVPFNRIQKRIVLRNCGVIDPENIDDAIGRGAYEALRHALTELTPDGVIEVMQGSGLRGRGGAGFSTGMKWRLTRDVPGDVKYVICNADEGDPGAFMDRSVAEGDPHAIIEGLAIAAYAIGARQGFVYVRAEYPLAVKRLGIAIRQAEERGFLGENIFGSGVDFRVQVRQGAGAFVCGEETALIASIEGKRGMPRPRPPFPSVEGLWRKPTCINNVETLANVAWILRNGADAYRDLGSEKSTGTKVFALTGKVRHGGLVEVPMGMTVRELVYDVGGGCQDDVGCKAVQIGGPSGGCLPEELFDTPIEYEALVAAGAIVGSGGMVVVDETTCMVDLARYFLTFTQHESCGKCVPCRVGTKRMLEIVTRICEGKGQPDDIDRLETLANDIKATSLCGLGQTAPNPVLTTLRYFRHEYEEHIFKSHCRAGACTHLMTFEITDACKGCGVCKKNCPVSAISGAIKEVHVIDQERCLKCGVCVSHCPFDAIVHS